LILREVAQRSVATSVWKVVPEWCYATGSHEWADFVSCDEASPLPGGVGDIDYFKASYWKDFLGVTVRTYDSNTGLWRIYWVDNRFSAGVIQPPVVGKFKGNVGIFEGPDTYKGIPVVVRYTWTLNPAPAATAPQWEKVLNPKGTPVAAKWSKHSRGMAARPGRPIGTTN
jgi:hypothetical protein